jgi:hypothetical protein
MNTGPGDRCDRVEPLQPPASKGPNGRSCRVSKRGSCCARNGIVVAGAGSAGTIKKNTIRSVPSNLIGSNGIVVSGGTATVGYNTVTGNECNNTLNCGSDFETEFQAAGILLHNAALATTVSHNDVHMNDMGIYADSGGEIDHNDASQNRYFGLVLCSRATFGCTPGYASTVDHNIADGANYGVRVYGGTGTFTANSAHGNATFDLWWDSMGSPTFGNNSCGTASPDKATWDCK